MMSASLLGLSHSPFFVIEMFMYALIGGVLPSLIWMWFWMHESYDHDEPKWVIAFTFIVGMCSVFFVYPFQKLFPSSAVDFSNGSGLWIITSWAFLEELFKFAVAFFCALQFKKVYNEPIDAFIYMMTAALGFTALENTFYLLAPLLQGDTMGGIMTTNLRFMGASLLHVVASGALAISISYGFYAPTYKKIFFWIYGLILATILHTLFNYFIIIATEESTFLVFSFVWLTTIILILALERVKAIKKF